MFFKKKSSDIYAKDIATLLLQIGAGLYKGIGSPDRSSTVTALLEFDDQQRVINIKDLIVDGIPKLTTFETVENINNIASPLGKLPENQKLKALHIEIENGQVNASPEYLQN